MSRHRFIRNLDIDDELDDYYGDDDEYDRPAPVVKKVSKLAALAAARKNQVNKLPTSELEAVRQPVRTPTTDVSIRLQKASNVTGRVNGTSNNKGEQAGRPSMEASLESSSITPTIRLSDVQGTPSPFARTIKGQESHPSSLNGFKKPSPDDQYVLGQKRAERVASNGMAEHSAVLPSRPKDQSLTNGIKPPPIESSNKTKHKMIDVPKEYDKLHLKNSASFVVIGHVDSGKSTLMGRLLVDLKVIDQRTVDKYRREADKIGKSSFALAWVLDSTTEERDRGVTVDFAMRNFETPKTKYTILDAPGHQDFVPNMIAGAAQADFAVLVVDASPNSFESGFQGGGQTKEHALLIRSMGVSRVVVAVNKLDAVAWSQARYTEIEQQLAAFLTSAGFQKQNLTFVPCSGLGGQNVVAPPAEDLIPWYSSSGTLIDALDAIKPTARALQKPLRLVVNEVFRSGPQNLLSIGGRLEAGHVQVGERILAVPAAATCQVRGVEIAGESREWAVAGDNVVLQLSSDVEETALKAGDVICPPAHPVASVGEFLLKALAFECLTPMHVEVHRGRLHVGGRVAEMRAVVDKVTGKVLKLRPRVVQPGSLCRLRVVLDGVVPLEAGARVVLRAGGRTVAAGLLE